MIFSAVYEEIPETEGSGYVAFCKEMPSAISEGDTLREAHDNLRDAIAMLLGTRHP